MFHLFLYSEQESVFSVARFIFYIILHYLLDLWRIFWCCCIDDWSDKASENSSTNDEGGGGGMEADSDTGASASASSKPKKPAKTQHVAAVRKNHLNIVFIGHVGKSVGLVIT